MRSAAFPPSAYRYSASLRSRIAALFLALAMSVLVIAILIMMGALPPGAGEIVSKLIAVDLSPPQAARKRPPAIAGAKHATAAAVKVRPPVPVPEHPEPPFKWIKLSREEYAGSDIGKMARHAASADSGQGGAADSGPDEGPGGARLYNAEWYRKPTRAELVTYLPAASVPGDWAMIVCRTIEKNRVDDCRELSDSRPGSGLAHGLRNAAWQFLIRPPRADGRPIIGAWVRIRFDLTTGEVQ
jgi:protein TonB